jgi:hypothetical protein
MTQDSSTPETQGSTESAISTNYSPAFSAPDLTLPGTAFGLLVGGGLATLYPAQAKLILTVGISVGWLGGFAATLAAEGM